LTTTSSVFAVSEELIASIIKVEEKTKQEIRSKKLCCLLFVADFLLQH
jgi:hypothetical protein